MKKAVLYLILLIFMFNIQAKEFKIALFYPRSEVFWNRVILFAAAACEDLNMKLLTYNGNDNHIQMVKTLKSVILHEKPDVVVFNNFKNIAPKFIKITNEAKIYSFLINSDLNDQNKFDFGLPGQKFKYWIGKMLPGEEKAGIEIAKLLLTKADEIVAVNGVHNTGAAIMRGNALRKVTENNSALMRAMFYTNEWSKESALKYPGIIKKRYPNVNGIWAANFSLALGVLEGAVKAKYKPGKNLYITGYDIPEELLNHIKSGEILGTTGGHFIEGAWAMVVIHDFLQGIKINKILETPMAIVTKENASLYLEKVNNKKLTAENVSKVDFKIFSKKFNNNQSYNFNLDQVLKEL